MSKRTSKPKKRRATRKARARRAGEAPERGEIVDAVEERASHPEASPVLSGGDVDADWQGALSSGEEAVGGSVATPDQDVVDEIGRALGVEQAPDAELHMSEEILRARTRRYWALEHRAAERPEP
ncbi:MAG TPA: DUF6335 family protein [Methylomirabilota bacterium]|nr:DUF6335 family protein [Methylomirabilota bacterium]